MSSIELASEPRTVQLRTDTSYQILLLRDLLRRIPNSSQCIDEELILNLPKPSPKPQTLHFFEVGHRVLFYKGVKAEYERRGLVPVHPLPLIQLLVDEPDFCFYLSLSTHWINRKREWCIFSRHRAQSPSGGSCLNMYSHQAHGYWEDSWSYVGVTKSQ